MLPRRDTDREIDYLIKKVNPPIALSETVKVKGDAAEHEAASINKQYRQCLAEATKLENEQRNFNREVKEMLFGECMHVIYCRSLMRVMNENAVPLDDTKKLVDAYIKENGVEALLRNNRYTSVLLSEICQLVEKYAYRVQEECKDCKDSKALKVPEETKDDFYDDLDMLDSDDVVFQISSRVNDAIDDFVTSNTLNKANIKQILQGSQEKLQNTKTDTQRESVERIAGEAIRNIKTDSSCNLFGSMVEASANSIVKDKALRETFMEGAKLDMDRIVNYCTLSYTLMEMVNTMKMEKFTESDILQHIKNI